MTADAEERPTYAIDLRTGIAAPLYVRGCGGSGGRWCTCDDCAGNGAKEREIDKEEDR